MSNPISTCVICSKLVSYEEAITDRDGRPVHQDCLLSRHISISPLAIACPRCHAEPGGVCEVLLDEGLEIVHVERIKAAKTIDVSTQDRLARAADPFQSS
jgi:hypothetical protein